MYRGLVASLLGIPHVIIQFNSYEYLKNYFSAKYHTTQKKLPLLAIFISSIISKGNL
jgi:hypothetical protein